MIHILTDYASGGTFLTWSIHYLLGHNNYFLLERNQWIELPHDPINDNNAHKFIPNQPNRFFDCSAEQFINFADALDAIPTTTSQILYFHPFNNADTTKAATNYSNSRSRKLVVVDTSKSILYHCSYRQRAPQLVGNKTLLSDNHEIQQYFINKFFKDSKKRWDDLKLQNIWDTREFLALNFRPFDRFSMYEQIDKTRDHYVIHGTELWTLLDHSIKNLFDYLDDGIDQQRLENWRQVYNAWRSVHYQRIMFLTYFEDIIDGILNNHNIDLTRFDLDIEQEAAIQHVLIYRHNLNLKTWQLEKFKNTQQLHNLLEPNIHSLSS